MSERHSSSSYSDPVNTVVKGVRALSPSWFCSMVRMPHTYLLSRPHGIVSFGERRATQDVRTVEVLLYSEDVIAGNTDE